MPAVHSPHAVHAVHYPHLELCRGQDVTGVCKLTEAWRIRAATGWVGRDVALSRSWLNFPNGYKLGAKLEAQETGEGKECKKRKDKAGCVTFLPPPPPLFPGALMQALSTPHLSTPLLSRLLLARFDAKDPRTADAKKEESKPRRNESRPFKKSKSSSSSSSSAHAPTPRFGGSISAASLTAHFAKIRKGGGLREGFSELRVGITVRYQWNEGEEYLGYITGQTKKQGWWRVR